MRWPLTLAMIAIMGLGSWMVAQNPSIAERVGYVSSTQVVEAHSEFGKVKDVQAKAKAELEPVRNQLLALQAKIQNNTATAADRQQAQVLQQTAQELTQKWQKQQATALQPISKDADTAITKVAKEQGFGMVLDADVARDSGLVIYADKQLDLADAVIKALPK